MPNTPTPAPQPPQGGSYTRDPATGALVRDQATQASTYSPKADPLDKAALAEASAAPMPTAAPAAPAATPNRKG